MRPILREADPATTFSVTAIRSILLSARYAPGDELTWVGGTIRSWDAALVQVTLDDGTTGVGEAGAGIMAAVAVPGIVDAFAPYLVGSKIRSPARGRRPSAGLHRVLVTRRHPERRRRGDRDGLPRCRRETQSGSRVRDIGGPPARSDRGVRERGTGNDLRSDLRLGDRAGVGRLRHRQVPRHA